MFGRRQKRNIATSSRGTRFKKQIAPPLGLHHQPSGERTNEGERDRRPRRPHRHAAAISQGRSGRLVFTNDGKEGIDLEPNLIMLSTACCLEDIAPWREPPAMKMKLGSSVRSWREDTHWLVFA